MKTTRFLSVALGMLAVAAPLQAGIDFTLRTKQEGDGAPDPENRYIADGENHIYLRIPHGWSASGNAGQLTFLPAQPSSEVQVRQLGGPTALPLDAGGLEALRKSAQASVPQGAKDIKPSSETNNLLPIFGWKSFEATFDYEFYGQPMRRSVLYINMLPGRVIQVSVTSPVPDFEQIHEGMRKMMYGWFEPKRDLNPDDARDYEEGKYKGG